MELNSTGLGAALTRVPGFARVLGGSAFLILGCPAAAGVTEGPWALPEPGSCVQSSDAEDGSASPFPKPGRELGEVALGELERWLAPEVWEARHRLFAGATVRIGPCFRRYRPPALFLEATRLHSGRASLNGAGGIEGTVAGLPFPPETIAVDAHDVGARWAWNTEHRWQGAGRFGAVRVAWQDRGGTSGSIEGEHFVARLLGRADLPGTGFKLPWAKRVRFVAGGRMRDAASGRRCAYRQMRSAEAQKGGGRPDDLFFWSSAMRRAERVGWDPELPMLACAYSRGFHLARGGRVDRYRWRVAGTYDLLFPINLEEDPSGNAAGMSLGRVRLELRRTLVLETGGEEFRVRRYFDLETLFPLLLAETHRGARSMLLEAGRWSGDRSAYPDLGDLPGSEVRVLDPVFRIELHATEEIRTEAWETTAVPPSRMNLRREVSPAALTTER